MSAADVSVAERSEQEERRAKLIAEYEEESDDDDPDNEGESQGAAERLMINDERGFAASVMVDADGAFVAGSLFSACITLHSGGASAEPLRIGWIAAQLVGFTDLENYKCSEARALPRPPASEADADADLEDEAASAVAGRSYVLTSGPRRIAVDMNLEPGSLRVNRCALVTSALG